MKVTFNRSEFVHHPREFAIGSIFVPNDRRTLYIKISDNKALSLGTSAGWEIDNFGASYALVRIDEIICSIL